MVSPDDVALDPSKPNAARMYDYFLGGANNFAADREAAESAERAYPGTGAGAQVLRSFLRRVVRYLVHECGVTQFLDLGSGVPTVGNVHQVARELSPAVRVVYVDVEPVAVAHSRNLLGEDPNATVMHADLRDVDEIFGTKEVQARLDFDQPVAVLMLAVLHFLDDDTEVSRTLARYREALAPGSYLAISHGSEDGMLPADAARLHAVYNQTATPVTTRTREQIVALFEGFELLAPGVVSCWQWRPDQGSTLDVVRMTRLPVYGGLGRKPES